MKSSNLRRRPPATEPHDHHPGTLPFVGPTPAPLPPDRGVPVRLVREGDAPPSSDPAVPKVLQEYLTRFEGAGLSHEILARALGLPASVLATYTESSNPPRWLILALAGVAASHGIPATALTWLRTAAEQAE